MRNIGLYKYASQYKKLYFYWKGWSWGYAIMVILDANNEYKLRLAKCKKNEDFPVTTMFEWVEVDTSEVHNLDQRGLINFKTKQEIEECFMTLSELFPLIEDFKRSTRKELEI